MNLPDWHPKGLVHGCRHAANTCCSHPHQSHHISQHVPAAAFRPDMQTSTPERCQDARQGPAQPPPPGCPQKRCAWPLREPLHPRSAGCPAIAPASALPGLESRARLADAIVCTKIQAPPIPCCISMDSQGLGGWSSDFIMPDTRYKFTVMLPKAAAEKKCGQHGRGHLSEQPCLQQHAEPSVLLD